MGRDARGRNFGRLRLVHCYGLKLVISPDIFMWIFPSAITIGLFIGGNMVAGSQPFNRWSTKKQTHDSDFTLMGYIDAGITYLLVALALFFSLLVGLTDPGVVPRVEPNAEESGMMSQQQQQQQQQTVEDNNMKNGSASTAAVSGLNEDAAASSSSNAASPASERETASLMMMPHDRTHLVDWVDFGIKDPYDDMKHWAECRTCRLRRPPRAAHCYSCQVCSLQSDHHCLCKRSMELLTRDHGWVDYQRAAALYNNDRQQFVVAGYNRDAGSIVYETPSAFHVRGTEGQGPDDDMFEIHTDETSNDVNPLNSNNKDGAHISLRTTGGHEVWILDSAVSSARTTNLSENDLDDSDDGKIWRKVTVRELYEGKWAGQCRSRYGDTDPMYTITSASAGNALGAGADLEQLLGRETLHDLIPALKRIGAGETAAPNSDCDFAASEQVDGRKSERVAVEKQFLLLYGLWLGGGTLDFMISEGSSGKHQFTPLVKVSQFGETADIALVQSALDALGLQQGSHSEGGDYHIVSSGSAACTGWAITRRSWVNLFFSEYGFKCSALRQLSVADEHAFTDSAGNNVSASIAHSAKLAACDAVSGHVNRDQFATEDEYEAAVINALQLKSANWVMKWCLRLGADYAKELVAGINKAANGKGSARCIDIATSSIRFRDQLLQLALLAGFSAYAYRDSEHKGDYDGNNETMASANNWKVCYSNNNNESESESAAPIIQRKHITKLPKAERHGSWCVTVPSGNIVVRRKPTATMVYRPIIIGNCGVVGGCVSIRSLRWFWAYLVCVSAAALNTMTWVMSGLFEKNNHKNPGSVAAHIVLLIFIGNIVLMVGGLACFYTYLVLVDTTRRESQGRKKTANGPNIEHYHEELTPRLQQMQQRPFGHLWRVLFPPPSLICWSPNASTSV